HRGSGRVRPAVCAPVVPDGPGRREGAGDGRTTGCRKGDSRSTGSAAGDRTGGGGARGVAAEIARRGGAEPQLALRGGRAGSGGPRRRRPPAVRRGPRPHRDGFRYPGGIGDRAEAPQIPSGGSAVARGEPIRVPTGVLRRGGGGPLESGPAAARVVRGRDVTVALGRTWAVTLQGVGGQMVEVEADVGRGLPA